MAFQMSRIDKRQRTYTVADNLGGTYTTVDVALLRVGTDPTAATIWTSVPYSAGVATVVWAGPDADATGAIVVPSSAQLWIKGTNAPYVQAVEDERITILGGGAPLAIPTGVPVISVNGKLGAAQTLTAADVGAPTTADLTTGLATKVNSSTYTAGLATLVPKWQPNTAYALGAIVMAPDGSIVTPKVAFTSGASYSGTNWNPAQLGKAPVIIDQFIDPGALGLLQQFDYAHMSAAANLFHIVTTGAAIEATPAGGGPILLSLGMDAGGVGFGIRNKRQGTGMRLSQLDTIIDPAAYMLNGTQSSIAPFMNFVMDTTNAASIAIFKATKASTNVGLVRIEGELAGAPTLLRLSTTVEGAGQLLQEWRSSAGRVGAVAADTGKLSWQRSIETVAPNSGVTPTIRVADEATFPSETYLAAKTGGDTGQVLYRNAGSGDLLWSAKMLLGGTNGNDWVFKMGDGPVAKGGETYKTLITMRGTVGSTGGIGYFGATPVGRQTAAAAATDLASVIALANSLRTGLINFGKFA